MIRICRPRATIRRGLNVPCEKAQHPTNLLNLLNLQVLVDLPSSADPLQILHSASNTLIVPVLSRLMMACSDP